MESEADCEVCGDTGTMTWMQPVPDGHGGFVLKQVEHPCACPRSRWWRPPAAESRVVIDPDDRVSVGNVARANAHHRTDWSRPL
ncbi:hypothetical protein GCM10010492_50010 [Saccharothrix mutabilis subsp. mutabilis]|uniref:Uncharacterized protein n=2 Tax=Saccharothrix mutabilis TaxID=33921 RepID=A0ABN0UB28_9PSEU